MFENNVVSCDYKVKYYCFNKKINVMFSIFRISLISWIVIGLDWIEQHPDCRYHKGAANCLIKPGYLETKEAEKQNFFKILFLFPQPGHRRSEVS